MSSLCDMHLQLTVRFCFDYDWVSTFNIEIPLIFNSLFIKLIKMDDLSALFYWQNSSLKLGLSCDGSSSSRNEILHSV